MIEVIKDVLQKSNDGNDWVDIKGICENLMMGMIELLKVHIFWEGHKIYELYQSAIANCWVELKPRHWSF